ncbi:MAG: diguanylate cyclase [Lachnospiraceae bacterium]|nr:diguanylate cyclase [Lachnospiraceae bacterium]
MIYRLSADNIEYDGEVRVKSYSVAYEDYLKTGLQTMEYVAYNVEHMLKTHASNAEILEFFERESEAFASETDSITTGIYGYINGEFLDGSGWVPDEDYEPTSRPWYVDAINSNEEVNYVSPYVDEMTGDTIMTICRPMSDGKSVIAVDFKMNEIGKITEKLLSEHGEFGKVILIDEDGTVIAHSDEAEIGKNYFDEDSEPARSIAIKALSEKEFRFDVRFDDNDEVFFSRPIGGGWYVISQTSRQKTYDRVFDAIRGSLIVGILGTIIIFSVLIMMTFRRIESENLTANLETVAGIYVGMFRMNLRNDKFEEISCTSEDLKEMVAGKHSGAGKILRDLAGSLVDDRSKMEVMEFIDPETLNDRMKSTDILTMEFMNHKDIWCRGRFVAADRDENGDLISLIWMIEYIDEEKRNRDRLQYLSETDRMTGINNRGCGENRIRKLLIEGDGGMFMVFDVDKFKSINDNYGHDTGDKVLIAIADCMKHAFRDKDIVMRLGGDEFAAYIPLVYSREGGGGLIIDRFLECVNAIRIEEMDGFPINISVGVAFYKPEDSFSFDELYKRADKCTYESKEKNGTHVSFYED